VLRKKIQIVMDKGYSDSKTCMSIREQGYILVVPPERNARKPWEYSEALYR